MSIAISAEASPGLHGLVERLITPAITRRIYRQDLTLLASYLRGLRDWLMGQRSGRSDASMTTSGLK